MDMHDLTELAHMYYVYLVIYGFSDPLGLFVISRTDRTPTLIG
jgi:hypothetical protein